MKFITINKPYVALESGISNTQASNKQEII